MASAAEVLQPQSVFDSYVDHANCFVRSPAPAPKSTDKNDSSTTKVKTKETVNADPADLFTLQDKHFVNLQLYVNYALKLPQTKELFKNTYPFDDLKEWLKDTEYKQMLDVLPAVHQHCADFNTNTINPLITLAHQIADYADNVVTYITELKNQLEIICDKNVDLSSQKAKDARDTAKELLKALKDASKDMHTQCETIKNNTSKFSTTTTQDKNNLDTLNKRLHEILPQSEFDKVVSDKIAKIRKTLYDIVKKKRSFDSWAVHRYTFNYFWIHFTLTWYDPEALLWLKQSSQEYEKQIKEGQRQKLLLIQSTTHARNLEHLIEAVDEAVDGATKGLQHMMDALARMDTQSDALITKIENLEGQVKPDGAGNAVMTGIYLDDAVKAWNKVYSLARQFGATGILKDAPAAIPPEVAEKAPAILVAHYGGHDITMFAKLLFVDGERLIIDTKDMPIADPWEGVSKSLSILYRHENEMRVVVCDTSTQGTWYVSTTAIRGQGLWDDAVARAANIKPKTDNIVSIHAVFWGLSQITDSTVYQKIYDKAVNGDGIPATNEFFETTGNKDPWKNVKKSAAIIYTVDGSMKMISGKEGETMSWSW